MSTKKRLILFAILSTTLLFVACKKEMKPEAPQKVEKHQLIHRYIYNEQTFQIEFNYDNNDSFLGITRAVE